MSLKIINNLKSKAFVNIKKRKWSIFAFISFFIIFIGSVSAATFFSSKRESSIIVVDDNDYLNQYTNLNIVDALTKVKDKNNLIDFTLENNDYVYYFSDALIKDNIIDVIKKAIRLIYWFKDDIDEYNISARYYIHQGRKRVEFNIFLYNKTISNKKFKSMFILEVY